MDRRLTLGRAGDHAHTLESRVKRLASHIAALAEKDERALRLAGEVREQRQAAAAELHGVCAAFVNAVNGHLPHAEVTLDPPEFPKEAFREDGTNLVQINARGRILQAEFQATPELTSTEDFRIPYTLEGSVRAFNQDLLDRNVIEEQLLFYTMERHGSRWRYFDSRTYRSGPFDEDYLVSLMELLV